jgi:hypothetical protein
VFASDLVEDLAKDAPVDLLDGKPDHGDCFEAEVLRGLQSVLPVRDDEVFVRHDREEETVFFDARGEGFFLRFREPVRVLPVSLELGRLDGFDWRDHR